MFLKNKNSIFKIRRSKVTDYAALTTDCDLKYSFNISALPALVSATVVPTKSDSDVMFCLQSYH